MKWNKLNVSVCTPRNSRFTFVILQRFNSTFPTVIVCFVSRCRFHMMLRRVIERIVEHKGMTVTKRFRLNVSFLYFDMATRSSNCG